MATTNGSSILTPTNTPHTVSFTTTNIMTQFLSGVGGGLAIGLGITTWFYHRNFPSRTLAASATISIATLVVKLFALLFDYLELQDCFFRVKFLYGVTFLAQISYWLFQADLAHSISTAYSKSIAGTPFIIAIALLVRVGFGIYVTIRISSKLTSTFTCISALDSQINLLDKLIEMIYYLILSVVFTYPILMGVKEMSESIPLTSSTTSGTRHASENNKAVNQDPRVVALKWLKRIIRDQGSILILSLVVEIVYLICIYTSGAPTLVGMLNAIFSAQYVVFMMIYMMATVSRRGREAQAKLDRMGSLPK